MNLNIRNYNLNNFMFLKLVSKMGEHTHFTGDQRSFTGCFQVNDHLKSYIVSLRA